MARRPPVRCFRSRSTWDRRRTIGHPANVAVVVAVALAVAVAAAFVPAVRAARTSTVQALADAARVPAEGDG